MLKLRFRVETYVYVLSILLVALTFFWVKFRPINDPIPKYIKSQLDFKVIFPIKNNVMKNSWKINKSQGSLVFNVNVNGINTVFTEEKAPLQFQDDVASYNRFVGSLKPKATFNSPLGSVSITNFVTQGDYDIVGATGLLNSHGTFLLIHPTHNFTDDQWRNTFKSLKFSK